MARHPKNSGKGTMGEYAVFEDALKRVLSVPYSDLKSKIAAAKRKKPKRSSASHPVND